MQSFIRHYRDKSKGQKNFKFAFLIQFFVLGLCLSQRANALPEFRFVREFGGLAGKNRTSLVAIYNLGTPEKPDFRMARPSIMPLDQDGKLVWGTKDRPLREILDPIDRIVIEKDMFGPGVKVRHSFPGCLPRNGFEVFRQNDIGTRSVAWLVTCSDEVLQRIKDVPPRVVYDLSRGEIKSRFYSYKFEKENHMLFNEVVLNGESNTVVAKNSDLYIRSDVKKFFTLNFSSSDIESKLVNHRSESLAALASIGFYLKVLFFKLTLDLTTDVAFFEKSANIPMIMTLPMDGPKRLHRKSGVLYSFNLGDDVDLKNLEVNMPELDPNLLKGDFKTAALPRCREFCIFELGVRTSKSKVSLSIGIERSLVEKGLFPWFVRNIDQHKEAMGWSLRKNLDMKNRVGLYLEVSQLPKGSHPWDFWISF